MYSGLTNSKVKTRLGARPGETQSSREQFGIAFWTYSPIRQRIGREKGRMAQNVQQNLDTWKAKLDKKSHEKNALTDLLEKLETKTDVRRLYLVHGVGVFFGLYLMVGYGAAFLCNFVGFLYPAYASIKVIESKETDDDTK